MGIDHGGFHIAVSQQVRGERMAEGVAGGRSADCRCLHSCSPDPLHKARIQMVPPLDGSAWFPPAAGLWKQPVPAPFPGCIPGVPLQGVRQLHSAPPCREIGLVQRLHEPQATAIEQLGHQGLPSIEMTQNGPNFRHDEQHEEPLPPMRPVESKQRSEGLVLGGAPAVPPGDPGVRTREPRRRSPRPQASGLRLPARPRRPGRCW